MSDIQNLSHLIAVVRMTDSYTTSSHGLGERTYRKGSIYRMTPQQAPELVERGVGELLDWWDSPRSVRPNFAAVRIVPRVTQWHTSDGQDTHHLKAGVESAVPSNLAAFLLHADKAELAA